MTSSTGPPTEVDRARWRSVPIAERITLAQKLIVLHPRFRDAIGLLERCHRSFGQPNEPACGALLGASGVGKTSVVDHYSKLHPGALVQRSSCRRFWVVTVLSVATFSTFVREFSPIWPCPFRLERPEPWLLNVNGDVAPLFTSPHPNRAYSDY